MIFSCNQVAKRNLPTKRIYAVRIDFNMIDSRVFSQREIGKLL